MLINARRVIAPLAGLVNLKAISALTGVRTIFPFYHAVSDDPLPHIGELYPVPGVKKFESDLETMLKHFRPVQMSQVFGSGGAGQNKRQMVLSFDDGLHECHRVIAPILRKKGVPAMFFLNNRFIGNRDLFFRYKAGMLAGLIREDPVARRDASEFLMVDPEQVSKAVMMVTYRQQPLLDALSEVLGFDFREHMRSRPVYMDEKQVEDLMEWGFEIGAHGTEHQPFFEMGREEMIRQVHLSVKGLRERFGVKRSYFAFPFTAAGVPFSVKAELLEGKNVDALFGTAGMKRTHLNGYFERLPMEPYGWSASKLLKTEYLYYLGKAPFGKNVL